MILAIARNLTADERREVMRYLAESLVEDER